MFAPHLISTLLQSRPLPLKDSVTDGVNGLGAAVLEKTAVRVLDIGAGKETYVIIPEQPNTIEHYRAFAEAMAAKKRRVIVYDPPGYGFSYPTFAFGYSIADHTEAMRQLLTRLKVRKATVCAAGPVNAYAAIALARSDDMMVKRLVLTQAPALHEARGWVTRMDLKGVLVRPYIGQAAAFLGKGHMFKYWYRSVQPEGANLDPFTDLARFTFGQGAAFTLASTFQELLSARSHTFDAGDEELDVVLIWGDADRSYEGVSPDSIKAHVKGVRVEIFEGAGHFPDLEDLERFEAVLSS